MTTATCGGNITSDGGSSIIAKGVCWDVTQTPTINGSKTADGSGYNFTSAINGLTPNTKYYVRAYATNNVGTGYGNEQEFKSSDFPNCGTVTDIDGNIYNTVIIGSQCWMRENLKVTRLRDGSPVIYYDYDNNPSNSATYGRLYSWYGATINNLPPLGWHVPSYDEWKTLIIFLGDQYNNPGGKLKEAGMTHWKWNNYYGFVSGTNITGFTALPGGEYNFENSMGLLGGWWSSTDIGNNAYIVELVSHNNWAYIYNNYKGKTTGASVRCIKD